MGRPDIQFVQPDWLVQPVYQREYRSRHPDLDKVRPVVAVEDGDGEMDVTPKHLHFGCPLVVPGT